MTHTGYSRTVASGIPRTEYADLRRLVQAHGLFERQPTYYAWKIALTLTLLLISVAVLLSVDAFWVQLLNAVYLGFVFTQIATLGHDIGHGQVTQRKRGVLLGTVVVDLLVGISLSWWIERHNRHHAHPNQVDLDPDIDTPLFALTEFAPVGRESLQRLVIRWQAYLFFPAQMLAALVLRVWSIQYLLQGKSKHAGVETVAILAHVVIYAGLLLSCLSLKQAIVFYVVSQAAFGLYIGSIFAPNHKGMLTWDKDAPLDFLRQQVLTSRNVRAHPVNDFWYAGSNYQIEHHLFPTMPRNNLRQAQQLVREFCALHAIPYCETGVLQSYREILQSLNEISVSLRTE